MGDASGTLGTSLKPKAQATSRGARLGGGGALQGALLSFLRRRLVGSAHTVHIAGAFILTAGGSAGRGPLHTSGTSMRSGSNAAQQGAPTQHVCPRVRAATRPTGLRPGPGQVQFLAVPPVRRSVAHHSCSHCSLGPLGLCARFLKFAVRRVAIWAKAWRPRFVQILSLHRPLSPPSG